MKKKAVIFGVGRNFERRKSYYFENYEIVGFVDNNKVGQIIKGWGGADDGKEAVVCSINDLNAFCYDVVIITPTYYKEMKEQLLKFGVPEEKILIDVFLFWEDKDSAANHILGMKSYSQHGEDIIVASIFLQIGIEKPTYMDLGANSPFVLSNTALMHENGCKGINIDASPKCIELLKLYRPDDVNLNVGVGDNRGVLPFYVGTELCMGNSFKKSVYNEAYVIRVPVVTLNDIVQEHCKDGFPVFLDCDIEDYDYEVLNSYNLNENGPKVICVEVRRNEEEKFDTMIKGKGYFKFCRCGGNCIYVRNDYKSVLL